MRGRKPNVLEIWAEDDQVFDQVFDQDRDR